MTGFLQHWVSWATLSCFILRANIEPEGRQSSEVPVTVNQQQTISASDWHIDWGPIPGSSTQPLNPLQRHWADHTFGSSTNTRGDTQEASMQTSDWVDPY